MDAQVGAEIAIATALQLGALLWFLSGVRADLRNLTGWVLTLSHKADTSVEQIAELRGRINHLPCDRCPPQRRTSC